MRPNAATPPIRRSPFIRSLSFIRRLPFIHHSLFTIHHSLFLLLFLPLLGLSLARGLNHDEHQFIASGALLLREGLLPYRDYPYFHSPYLVFVYAALFQVSGSLLGSARLFSVLCGWASLALLISEGLRLFREPAGGQRGGLALGGALLLMATPLWVYTSGRAWNHDLPLLLTLLALHCHRCVGGRWQLLSGLLVGLAAGTRLSFAVVALPLAGALLLASAPRADRVRALLAFGAGLFMGLLPLLALASLAPREALFGLLGYVRYNTLYYSQLLPAREAMTPLGKLLFLARTFLLEPGHLLLLLPLAAALLAAWRTKVRPPELSLLLALLAALLLGAFAATPTQTQYFFALVPFLVLTLLATLAALPANPWLTRLFVGCTAFACLLALPQYAGALRLPFPSEWFPSKTQRDGRELAALVQSGQVVTLAPIPALEGGAEILPALATGSFAWRIAPLVPEEERQALGLLTEDALLARMEDAPPRALLVGLDNDDAAEEAPLVAFATERGYLPVPLTGEGTLWLSPQAAWGEQIRLGAYTLAPTPLQPGSPAHLTLYLQAAAPIEQDLNVLVRLIASDGREVWRGEGWPFGSPTSTWAVGEVWRDGHDITLPADAPPGPYRLDVGFYDPATFAALPAHDATTGNALGDAFPVAFLPVGEPPKPTGPPADFGAMLRLLGSDLDPTRPVQPGETLTLRLVWQALTPLSTDYTIFVHLVAPDGSLVAQRDQPPLGGFFPTSAWQPGQTVADTYPLAIPPDAPPGSYTVHVGLYDPATGQRLPLTNRPPADSLVLGSVTVE